MCQEWNPQGVIHSDLAAEYDEVTNKVKRNIERYPKDFMVELSAKEFEP